MKFLSVCSGIEAASVAWSGLGWKASAFAEIEAFPSAVLAHHYPSVPNLGDMTKIARGILTGEVEAPDLLCGGTPCQAFSVAGLRASLGDARGGLTLKFVELADAIDFVRARSGRPPSIVFWENVPGVLSTKDNAFGCFLGALVGESEALEPSGGKWTDAGCVYGPTRAVAWRVLDAQYFGLAQRRRRVFVVASARNGFDPAEVLFERDGVRRDSAPSREPGQDAAAGTLRSTDGGCDVDHARAGHVQPVVGTLTAACGPNGHGGSGLAADKGAEAGHIFAFGGNRTSGAIDVSPALLAQPGSGWKGDFESETFLVAHTLRGEGFDASEDGTGRGTPLVPVAYAVRTANTSPNGSGISPELAHTLDLAQGQCVAFDATQITRATNPTSEHAYTLEARAEVQVIAYTKGEQHGRMDGGTPQSPNDLPSGAVRSLQRTERGGASQERGLEGPPAGEPAAIVQKLPHEGAQVGEEMHALRQPSQGPGLLRNALPAVQEVGRSDGGQGQPVHATAEGLRPASTKGLPSAGLHGEVPREGLLQQARPAGAPGNAGPAADDQIRGVPYSMEVRRLLPVECERLMGFPDGYTAIPWRKKPSSDCPDGPRYKALGNSWAVPVVAWIGRRIDAVLERLEPA